MGEAVPPLELLTPPTPPIERTPVAMTKKYELTDETRTAGDGSKLRRIRALVDIPSRYLNAGDLGGFVASENNLPQEDDCWVYGEARVYGEAWVYVTPMTATSRDAYTFAIFDTPSGPRITAGCRYFSPEEAVAHWTETRGGTPLGDERLRIVRFLVAEHTARAEEGSAA